MTYILLPTFGLREFGIRARRPKVTDAHDLSLEGGPSAYKGLPCPYASCVLASTCLLTKGNTFILCCMASLMILFMIDQSCYPHDEILESENWKKVVYTGGEFKLLQ